MLSRIFRALYENSPKTNFANLRAHLDGSASKPKPVNDVMDRLMESHRLPQLIAHSLAQKPDGFIVLAGNDERFAATVDVLRSKGRTAEWRPWRWGDKPEVLTAANPDRVVLSVVPETEEQWTEVAGLKKLLGAKFTLITEVVLPHTRIPFLQEKIGYAIADFDDLLKRYLGEKLANRLEDLNARWPLAGRSVIEFGPLDAAQTAGIVHLGAKSVTCIEARAENVTKAQTAAGVLGWSHVRVLMDDFHNADATTYGRYDLAFAHGVYYHSIAPFVFLENLRTLADAIYIGGFCATDDNPATPWLELKYEGRTYRAKEYVEADHFTAGVNRFGYYFNGEDLMRFFTERGHQVTVIADEVPEVVSGRYLRFLVTPQA